MNITRLSQLIVIVSLVAWSGCDQLKGPTGPEGEEGPPGPSLTGDLVGTVIPVEANGGFASDRSGVAVSVEGRSAVAVSDAQGRYTFAGLPTGTYNITFSKSGYGQSRLMGYQFVGGGTTIATTAYICKAPSYGISNLTIGAPSTSSVPITVSFNDGGSGYRRVMYFLGRSSSISSDPANYDGVFWIVSNVSLGTYSTSWSISTFRNYGFSTGSTVYVRVYTGTESNNSSGYTDLNTGRFQYTNLSSQASNVASFVLP